MRKSEKKVKNKNQYIIMSILTIIVFLVIYLSFEGLLSKKIYVDVMPKQPMNNIRGMEIKNTENDNNDNGNNKEKDDDEEPVSYVYTEDKSYGNYIYMIDQFPTRDEIGRELEGQYKTFDFKFEFNKKALGVDYVVTLEKMSGSDLDETWVKAYLTNEGVAVNNCIRSNGRIKTYNEYAKYNNMDNEVILFRGKVTESDLKRGYRNFRFRMWVSEDVKVENENYVTKSFIARVNVHVSGNI